jgi:hypothetical protein
MQVATRIEFDHALVQACARYAGGKFDRFGPVVAVARFSYVRWKRASNLLGTKLVMNMKIRSTIAAIRMDRGERGQP